MEIVIADKNNFDRALEAYTAAWRESHRNVCTPEFLERRDCEGYLQAKMDSLYVILDEEPVGIFCLKDGKIGDLYIHPSKQGRGYGTACLRFAVRKCPQLRLSVLSSNHNAIRLYENVGFRFTGRDIPLREGLWEREMRYTEK